MKKKAILFLGTSLIGSLYIREAAELLGFHAVFLLRLNDYSGDPRRAIESSEHYEADINSVEDVSRAIQENKLLDKYDVAAVTSFLDETFPIVLAIASKFDIAGPDITLGNLTDKAKVRELIPEFSPPSLTFNSSTISETDLEHFFQQCSDSSQFLLKPGISSGAVGISVLSRQATKDQVCQLIRDSHIEAENQNWILQPRISGRLHSLEGYVKDGEVFFLGFARRVRKDLTEVANEYPVDDDLALNVQQRCQAAVKALVERSGYMYGYFHCEFIINDSSAYLIDPNMGRLSGGAFVQHLARFYGLEPATILKHVIDLGPFKGRHTPDFKYIEPTHSERTLAINYCIENPATVLDIAFPENATSYHTRLVNNGKAMPGVGSSDSAWTGFIAGYYAEVLNDIQKIVIETEQGSIKPYYLLNEQSCSKNHYRNTLTSSRRYPITAQQTSSAPQTEDSAQDSNVSFRP